MSYFKQMYIQGVGRKEIVNYPECLNSFLLGVYGMWDFYWLSKDFCFMIVVLN